MNYDTVDKFRKDLDEMGPFHALVCDEAQYLTNGHALRTRAILGSIDFESKKTAINTTRKWFITGSPVLNNPIELYPLPLALDPRIAQVRDIDEFLRSWCLLIIASFRMQW
jgi:SNF2 family DNA or RNA helicase